MADQDSAPLPVSSLRSRFEQFAAISNTSDVPQTLQQKRPTPSRTTSATISASPEQASPNSASSSSILESSALAAALKRPPPPPPTSSLALPISRSPSPAPPSSPRLSARSGLKAPPLPSRSNLELLAMARNTIIHHELDTSSSSSNGGSGSRTSASALTECTSPGDPTADHDEEDQLSGLSDFHYSPTKGAGVRRGSLPAAAMRGDSLSKMLGAQPIVRASSDQAKPIPPAPPLRSKPMVPPRPGRGTTASPVPVSPALKAKPFSPISSPLLTVPALPAPQAIRPNIPPPLPSRDKKSFGGSDDDLPVQLSRLPPPPPPPRRSSPSEPPPSPSIHPAPPSHPGAAQGRTFNTIEAPSHHPSLRSAFNKVKKALPLAQGDKPKPRAQATVRPASMASEETEDLPADGSPPASRPLPPPIRGLSVLDKFPQRRRSVTPVVNGTEGEDGDGSSESSSDEGPNGPSPPTAGPSHQLPGHRRTLDELPDASRSNRRPPLLVPIPGSSPLPPIAYPAHVGVCAVAGDIVCVASTSVRIYDLSVAHRHMDSSALSPHLTIDLKDAGLEWRVEKPRITALGFRPGRRQAVGKGREDDEGRYLWCGTKDGHLCELDVMTGHVMSIKSSAHGATIIHILRSGEAMVTIDENGKALVFGSRLNEDGEDRYATGGISYLLESTPRVFRIADKQAFARLMYGKLWTSHGPGAGSGGSSSHDLGTGGTPVGAAAGSSRGSTIRVYDIFAGPPSTKSSLDDASTTSTVSSPTTAPQPVSRHGTLLQTEPGVGAVTSGTVLASKPGLVYLGHEGGYVTVWDATSSATPGCVQTVKIATSDVMSIEGVHSRVWAGSRKGLISAYDVETKPWKVTNVWKHSSYGPNSGGGSASELPVLKLIVDALGIEKTGRLAVVSIGRDEYLRFWDGLLGSNWIEGELLKREERYSSFRNINLLVCTWNVGAARPESLGDFTKPKTKLKDAFHSDSSLNQANIYFLNNCLKSVERPDILVFGFQEVIDLESRKLTAKTMLLGSHKNKRNPDGTISDKVSRAYNEWFKALQKAVQVAMPPDSPYTVIHTEDLVGLFTCIFVRNDAKANLRDIAITTVKRGMGGRYGNKGAIVARFVIDDSSICFVNCHLAAGQHHKQARNQDLAAIFEEKTVFPEVDAHDGMVAYAGGGDGSMVLDHEFVFLNGDLNYRIDQRREAVIANIREGELDYLLSHDQLLKERKQNPGFRLRPFIEAPITFAPTYKYDVHSNEFDTSEKRRVPAWCDRILFRCRNPDRVENLHYQRYEANVSDHRPVSAGFTIRVKSVKPEEREEVQSEVQVEWEGVQQRLLGQAKLFYKDQGWI